MRVNFLATQIFTGRQFLKTNKQNRDTYHFQTNGNLGTYCGRFVLLPIHVSDNQTKVKYAKTLQYVLASRKTCEFVHIKHFTHAVKDITAVFIMCCHCLCGSWPVIWHPRVWCVELSGGNVGGERVQREEEGGRKGTVWCGDF